MQRRVRLSAADPGSTPVTAETVAAALEQLLPALPASVTLEARRGFAMVTLTSPTDAGFARLNEAVVTTLLGGGVDVNYGAPAVSEVHVGAPPEERVRRWYVALSSTQVTLTRKERDLAAREHNFGTLFAKDSGSADPNFRVTLCGVDDRTYRSNPHHNLISRDASDRMGRAIAALNVGLVMRLLSCFGSGKLRHLSYESGGESGFWSRKETVKKILRVAKGGASKAYLPLDTVPVDTWVRQQVRIHAIPTRT